MGFDGKPKRKISGKHTSHSRGRNSEAKRRKSSNCADIIRPLQLPAKVALLPELSSEDVADFFSKLENSEHSKAQDDVGGHSSTLSTPSPPNMDTPHLQEIVDDSLSHGPPLALPFLALSLHESANELDEQQNFYQFPFQFSSYNNEPRYPLIPEPSSFRNDPMQNANDTDEAEVAAILSVVSEHCPTNWANNVSIFPNDVATIVRPYPSTSSQIAVALPNGEIGTRTVPRKLRPALSVSHAEIIVSGVKIDRRTWAKAYMQLKLPVDDLGIRKAAKVLFDKLVTDHEVATSTKSGRSGSQQLKREVLDAILIATRWMKNHRTDGVDPYGFDEKVLGPPLSNTLLNTIDQKVFVDRRNDRRRRSSTISAPTKSSIVREGARRFSIHEMISSVKVDQEDENSAKMPKLEIKDESQN